MDNRFNLKLSIRVYNLKNFKEISSEETIMKIKLFYSQNGLKNLGILLIILMILLILNQLNNIKGTPQLMRVSAEVRL